MPFITSQQNRAVAIGDTTDGTCTKGAVAIGDTTDGTCTKDGDTNFPEIGDVDNLTIGEIIAEDDDWLGDFGIGGNDWKADMTGKVASCEPSHGDELDNEYGYVGLQCPSSNNGCSNHDARQRVIEVGFRRPAVTSRAHREQLEEEYQQYEREDSSEEDAWDEEALKPSWLASSHDNLDESWNIPLSPSPDDKVIGKAAVGADLESELALAMEEDALNDPVELDATTLELIAYTQSFRNPQGRKKDSKAMPGEPCVPPIKCQLYNSRPLPPYSFDNPLCLADSESSRTFPQDYEDWYEVGCSKGCLNDRTDAVEAAEALKILSFDLSSRAARARKSTALEDEVLDRWLDQSIATTNDLLRAGKTALASKASEMVGRVLANEKGVVTVGYGSSTTGPVEEESKDITSERSLSSRGHCSVLTEVISRDN
ncbi:hypothetical protein N7G274_006830 [Stereocaulon virgatum]|uniref:Uncharacterized protein n=1 Tax=Stereocaulon virgatum TaxID=373712 RepID=A0ABR4A381_9LECA